MNIRQELLANSKQSKETALFVADFACSSNANFNVLMDCLISGDDILAKRAAWSVRWAAEKRPDLIQSSIGLLVGQLQRSDVHDAVIRNILSILGRIEIQEELHGIVMDSCFSFIQNRKTPIAAKAFSMTILFNLSKIYPEIQNELQIIIEENIDFETAAFKSRAKKILNTFRKHRQG